MNSNNDEYISIYDKPKGVRGRPKSCILTDEEKIKRKRDIALKHYYDNYEYKQLYKHITRQIVKDNKG